MREDRRHCARSHVAALMGCSYEAAPSTREGIKLRWHANNYHWLADRMAQPEAALSTEI